MTKAVALHELIAIRNNVLQQGKSTLADLGNTMEKKHHHFTGRLTTFTSNAENAQPVVEDKLELQTTVHKELAWLKPYLAKAIDVSNHVNIGNTVAKADIVLEDGTPLIPSVPVTTLLELEDRFNELLAFVQKIPTLDPAKGFVPDKDKGAGVYVAREITKTRTLKGKKVYIKYPATDKHPAQTELVDEDMPTGTIRQQEWSGMLTVAEKGALVDRVEQVNRAVRQARSRANSTVVEDLGTIGSALLGYVFG